MKLSGYICKIEYLAGRDNIYADLLSRITKQFEAESVRVEPGVDERTYQISVIKSNRLGNRPVLETETEETTQVVTEPHWMEEIKDQEDSEIAALRAMVEAGETTKYALHEGRLYYLSGKDEEVRFVGKGLRAEILGEYHEGLGHMEIDDTCDLVGRTYYWTGLYNEITNRVAWHVRPRIGNMRKTDIPNCPSKKVSMDASRPYRETPRGNMYIVSFVDWLTNWPKPYK